MPRRCPPIPELSTYWRQGTHIMNSAAIWESRRHKLCRVFTRPGTTEARSVDADAGCHGIITHNGTGNYSVSSAFATWSGDSFRPHLGDLRQSGIFT